MIRGLLHAAAQAVVEQSCIVSNTRLCCSNATAARTMYATSIHAQIAKGLAVQSV